MKKLSTLFWFENILQAYRKISIKQKLKRYLNLISNFYERSQALIQVKPFSQNDFVRKKKDSSKQKSWFKFLLENFNKNDC